MSSISFEKQNKNNWGEHQVRIGRYTRGKIICEDGTEFSCHTYGMVNKEIMNRYGMFLMFEFIPLGTYILVQYLLFDEEV